MSHSRGPDPLVRAPPVSLERATSATSRIWVPIPSARHSFDEQLIREQFLDRSCAVEDFSWASSGDADAVTGSIKWTQLKDNSPNPDLIGFLDYTASGDAAFLASFGTHRIAEIDIVFRNLSSGILLDNLALTTNSETAVISSGEVVPTPVPEPASLALFGTGLLAMGWLTRRRRENA
jgi:PEP-CTERM motif